MGEIMPVVRRVGRGEDQRFIRDVVGVGGNVAGGRSDGGEANGQSGRDESCGVHI
jgi:hypothetical protein